MLLLQLGLARVLSSLAMNSSKLDSVKLCLLQRPVDFSKQVSVLCIPLLDSLAKNSKQSFVECVHLEGFASDKMIEKVC